MKLRSIETTPSPNCMKLNLNASVSDKPLTLSVGEVAADTPEVFQNLLAIAGIQSVFLMGDFITLTRRGNVDWQPILVAAGDLLGMAENADAGLSDSLKAGKPSQSATADRDFGQVEVAIQMFRGIPVQVRAIAGSEQARVALPNRFNQALQRAIVATQADYVAERIWSPYQPQFGNPNEIAQQVADELDSLTNEHDLALLEKAAVDPDQRTTVQGEKLSQQSLLAELKQSDWKRRLKAIQQIEIDAETFPAVVLALKDNRNAIRRWAAALLGASEQVEAVEPLCEVLQNDGSAIVRRTAGDALSDLGEASAIAAMVEALQDQSGLVRWRAGRFLNEVGDRPILPQLIKAAEFESEFDVRVEMQAAIDRIQAGKASQLPMWMRISQAK
ncbi:MAG: PBS lyase [Leptolyngbya foveolarum]|uniref:PBS lyase n=1 Tax=Leptolyngbya foveolarum TaxID=47253 RepID=A0A2W4UH27_9CYAN|nr:MAG: PBS lyase [Leptolyngbya foveolarum]